MEGFEKAEERIAQEIGKITGLGLRTCDCYTIAKAVMGIELFSFRDDIRNAGVIGRLEAAEKDKENLERTLEEINETLEANGISIDCDGNIDYSAKTKILAKIENYIDGIRYYLDKRCEIQSCHSDKNEVVVRFTTTDGTEAIYSLSLEELLSE